MSRLAIHVLCAIAILLVERRTFAASNSVNGDERRPTTILGSWSGLWVCEQIAAEFMKTSDGTSPQIAGCANVEVWKRFAKGEADVAIYSGKPGNGSPLPADVVRLLAECKPYPIGQFAVFVVVNRANQVQKLSIDQMRGILAGRSIAASWNQVGGSGQKITVYLELPNSKSKDILVQKVMTEPPPAGVNAFRPDYKTCLDYKEVLSRVAKDRNGIGFLLYRQEEIDGVKVVPIADKTEGPFHAPTPENIFEELYPLTEELTLYLHPDASPLAKEYCEFAVGPEGSKIAEKWYLYPWVKRFHHLAEARLTAMKAGKGDPIGSAGTAEGTFLMKELAVEYTRMKTVVQMAYAGLQEPSAVGAFVAGRDLLLMRGTVGGTELNRAVKAKWDALAHPAGDSTGIVERCIAGRAAVIVTHSLNKLDALTPDQVRAIFSGKVRDWKVLAAVGADVTSSEIHCYGPEAADPAFTLFFQKLDFRSAGRMERKKTGQEVLSALSMDPQGIAIVSLADLPAEPEKLGVKVLAIGEGKNAVLPTPQTVLDGSYLLAERFFLYVHPQASATARDFARFITTPGAAADAFRKNGFISAMPEAVPEPTKPAKKAGRK